ncbi:MAG TPA: glycosyltransferase [Spirochaetota bacterium]|nr:glycosyltransferase [Spirochaetota bacterium]
MNQGGTPYLLHLLSKMLSKYYDCRLAIFRNIQQYSFSGKIYDLKSPSSRNPAKILFYIFKRMILIRNIIKKDGIDLLFSHALISNFIAILVKKYFKLDIPLIVTFHTPVKMGVKDMGAPGYIAKWIIVRNMKYIDKIICVSEGLRQELHSIGFPLELIVKIYNPVDIELVKKSITKEPDKEFAIMKENPGTIIISAGRLVKAKNYSLLVEAFNIVRKKKKCKLIIIGDGSQMEELTEKVDRLGLSGEVIFPGWKDNPFNWIAHADVFVLSSSWEAFGNVIIEAFACNTPVVSTDCPVGPGEIITHGVDGLLANAEDKDDLAAKILLLLSDEKLYNALIRNGRKRADDFKIENQAKNYVKVLDPFLN